MLDAVGEQPVEPVGVPVLGGTQVSRLRGGRVLQAVLAGGLVVLGDELVHLAVNTAFRCVGGTGILQETLLLQLLVNAHLVLGIHDVEVGVAGLQAHRIFTRITHRAVSGTALLSRHDDNARHGPRTVDGGGGAVLQDVETLDIVGVQARDGGGDQRVGVTGGKALGVHFHDILHDHAVHHPERGGGTVDGGRTADADLRSRTEGAGNVLDGNTGHTAFQGAGDVSDTGDVRFGGVHLGGGAGEHTAVDGGHTGHDRLLEDLGIRFQGDTDLVPDRDDRFFEAHEGYNEILRILGHFVQDKVTVQIRKRSDLGLALHRHERSDDRFTVVGCDDRTADRPCLRKRRRPSKQEGTDTEQEG